MSGHKNNEIVCNQTKILLKCRSLNDTEIATYSINGTNITKYSEPDFTGTYNSKGVIVWSNGATWEKQGRHCYY